MGLDVRTYGNIKLAENEEDADFTAFIIDEDWKHKIKNLQDGKAYNANVLLPAVKLCVGQKLWLVRSHHYRNDDRTPKEVTISKVGKKYFELEDYPRAKFEIETLKQATETNYIDRCHLTLQDILDEREADKLAGQIKNIFGGYGKPKLTLEQLRKIMDVVGGKI